jgi:hypothetical protein
MALDDAPALFHERPCGRVDADLLPDSDLLDAFGCERSAI